MLAPVPEWFKSQFSSILGEHLTPKTNPEIKTSAEKPKTSELVFSTHFPSQILAAWPDTQY